MPRYFFHLEDRVFLHDDEGTELADQPAARLQAAAMVGEILKDNPKAFWDTGLWRLLVTDEDHEILFRIEFCGVSASQRENHASIRLIR